MSLPACPVCGAKDSFVAGNGYASDVAICRACAFYCSPEIWRALAERAAKAAAWYAHREMHEDGGEMADVADMDARLAEERTKRGLP